MLDYIHSHQAGFWIALGFILLALEVLVMGFTTLVLFFAGLGAVTTGLLMQFNVIPIGWISGIASFGILTGIYGVLLWKPFQQIQANSTPQQVQTSDLIGLEFVLEQDISLTQPGTTKYSGVTWKVELARDAGVDSISSSTPVVVCSLDAGIFRVKPL